MSSPVIGYAVKTATGICMRTVSPSRSGAIANWLVLYRGLIAQAGASDDAIEEAFAFSSAGEFANTGLPKVIAVSVCETTV